MHGAGFSNDLDGGAFTDAAGEITSFGGRFTPWGWFEIAAAEVVRQVTTGSGLEAVTRTYLDHQITVSGRDGINDHCVFASSDTTVATVNPSGMVTHLAAGTVTITATICGRSKSMTLVLPAVVRTPPEPILPIIYEAGSAGYAFGEAIDSRIAGITDPAMIDARQHLFDAGGWNASCWAACPALSCITASGPNGCLITRKHVACAAHNSPGVGGTFYFRLPNGDSVYAAAVAQYTSGDLAVLEMETAMPAGIVAASVLPAAWATKIAADRDGIHIPALCLNQFREALVHDASKFRSLSDPTDPSLASYTLPLDATRAGFYYGTIRESGGLSGIISGDSGSPALFMLGTGDATRLIFNNAWFGGFSGSGTGIFNQQSAVDAWMLTHGATSVGDWLSVGHGSLLPGHGLEDGLYCVAWTVGGVTRMKRGVAMEFSFVDVTMTGGTFDGNYDFPADNDPTVQIVCQLDRANLDSYASIGI